MPWEVPPIAVCTECRAPLHVRNSHLINKRCGHRIGGQCHGVYYGSTLKRSDWEPCKPCDGNGLTGNSRCGLCQGSGWHLLRDSLY
jgi:hypothetical protein